MLSLFVELIQIALGTRTVLSRIPSENEWQQIYETAAKQSLVGVVLHGIEELRAKNVELSVPKMLLLQWIGEVQMIEQQNKKLNEAAEHLTRIFKNGGLRSCVLKGQGVTRLYDVRCKKSDVRSQNSEQSSESSRVKEFKGSSGSLSLRRQPGDIDLWVEGGREIVLKFLKDSYFGLGKVVIHHVDARIIEGVETEIHFIPVYGCNPFLHHRLQCFFRQHADEQFSNINKELGFAYPTLRFNAVYILAHIYMHFLYEGIGLRQIVDYYYVLKNLDDEGRKLAASDIKKVGLLKFAGAVMLVLQRVCGMDDNSLVTKPDDKRGRLLLDEIMVSGNFGKYDDRLKNRDDKNLVLFNLLALKRQLRFLRYYPMDVISIPFFKVWHWCWRKKKGYR